MADRAVIVCSSYGGYFWRSGGVRAIEFWWICCRSCRVAFCLVLWFAVNVLGGGGSAVVDSNGPLVFAPMIHICLFLLCILVRIVYLEEDNRYRQPLTTDR